MLKFYHRLSLENQCSNLYVLCDRRLVLSEDVYGLQDTLIRYVTH